MKNETIVTADKLPADVVKAIKSGQKIEAIKLLRVATGIGLANAKVLVESGARLHGVKSTHPAMVRGENYSHGMLKLLLLALLAFGAYQYFLN
jgi:hypothetical protein